MKTKNYMTFKEAEQEIKRLDPNLSENSETFKVAALMLYGSLPDFRLKDSLTLNIGINHAPLL